MSSCTPTLENLARHGFMRKQIHNNACNCGSKKHGKNKNYKTRKDD